MRVNQRIQASVAFVCLMVATVGTIVLAASDTRLHEAAGKGDLGTTRRLLSVGLDPNGCDGQGRTPLMRAAEKDASRPR